MGIIFQVMLRAEISNNIIFYCKSIRIQDLIVGWLIAAIMLFLVFARKKEIPQNAFYYIYRISIIGSFYGEMTFANISEKCRSVKVC